MNALRVLMHQHDRVEGLLVDLSQMGEQNTDARRRALQEYVRLLRKHLDLEETEFYAHVAPRLILVSVDRFISEHRQIRALLHSLEAEVDAPSFSNRLEELHDLLVAHVSDEEIELFPEVRRRFNVDELDAFGERIEHAMDGGPSPSVEELSHET